MPRVTALTQSSLYVCASGPSTTTVCCTASIVVWHSTLVRAIRKEAPATHDPVLHQRVPTPSCGANTLPSHLPQLNRCYCCSAIALSLLYGAVDTNIHEYRQTIVLVLSIESSTTVVVLHAGAFVANVKRSTPQAELQRWCVQLISV